MCRGEQGEGRVMLCDTELHREDTENHKEIKKSIDHSR